uniref:Uncharacterized protein n=1 Tax=viral metagenome TaxID=1070528 RepID=A0A6C0IRG8_9ZZZZ
MTTKTAIKSISLYDCFINNKGLILTLIHYITTLYINHYFITNLNNIKFKLIELNQLHLYQWYNTLIYDLSVMQTITLLACASTFYINFQYNHSHEDIHILLYSIMIVSIYIKQFYTIYDCLFYDSFLYKIYDDFIMPGISKTDLHIINSTCAYYYIIMNIFIGIPILIIIAFILGTLMEYIGQKLNALVEWSKTYNIKYIQRITIENEEKGEGV